MFITEVKVKGHFALDFIILFCPAFCDITGIVKVDYGGTVVLDDLLSEIIKQSKVSSSIQCIF